MTANGTDRPNILWICSDQQRWDTVGALGNPHVRTPNLDRLCREGTAFTHAFCQSPICTPSRSSFLTGRYPSTVHGCRNGNDAWAEGADLLPKILRDGGGYDCGLSGKLHLAGANRRSEPRPEDDGYRFFAWSHSPFDDWGEDHAYARWVRERGQDLGALQNASENIPAEYHQTAFCAEAAADFMREARSGPWLMSVNMFDPHAPFDPPADYLARYDPAALPGPHFQTSDLEAQADLSDIDFQTESRRPEEFNAREVQAAYYAMIELVDEGVGRMLDVLEETGQRENTIIIFTSDHGEMLGDHGLLLKGCRFYEGLVRVPLIWSWPGRIRQGVVSSALAELTDIAPTLLEFAGVQSPHEMQGRSLASLLEGRTSPNRHRDFVRAEYYSALNPQASGRDGWLGAYATMLRTTHHKLVNYHGTGKGELFDLETDPWEFRNLWDDHRYAALRFRLMERSFDALAFAVDPGTPQTAYY